MIIIDRSYRRCVLTFAVGVALLSSNCTKVEPVGEVEGTVTVDGKLLNGIQVTYLPDPGKDTMGPTAVGITDDCGHYKLSAATGNQAGVVVGHHRVTLRDLKNFQPPGGRGGGRGPAASASPASRRIPAIYEDAGSTPLSREVKPGPQSINIEITSEPTKR